MTDAFGDKLRIDPDSTGYDQKGRELKTGMGMNTGMGLFEETKEVDEGEYEQKDLMGLQSEYNSTNYSMKQWR